MDLLAHSAGSVLATLYAAAYPERLSRLILVTPGLAAVGVDNPEDQFRATLARRQAEPWYPAAVAALERIMAGELTMDAYRASRPVFYGRWDDAARAHATVGISERHQAARDGYFAGASLDPTAIRAALKVLAAPVLLYAGDLDALVTPAVVREAAAAFNDATVIVQTGAGHFPWLDDPAAFSAAITRFLG
jgi:pimeloyl-ACP methyl ester carboxylesterase